MDGDFAGAAASRQPHLRLRIGGDHRGVQVAEPVDLGAAQEPDLDAASLQVAAEQVGHRHGAQRTGDERGVADRQRQARGTGAEHAGLVNQLEVAVRPCGAPGCRQCWADRRRQTRCALPPARGQRR